MFMTSMYAHRPELIDTADTVVQHRYSFTKFNKQHFKHLAVNCQPPFALSAARNCLKHLTAVWIEHGCIMQHCRARTHGSPPACQGHSKPQAQHILTSQWCCLDTSACHPRSFQCPVLSSMNCQPTFQTAWMLISPQGAKQMR